MYVFGGHAGALYNAEAVKSQVRRPLVKGAVPRIALAAFYLFAPQQAYADVQPRVFPTVVRGQRPPLIKQFSAAPQLLDLTIQGTFSRPFVAQGPVPPLTQAAPQLADLTLQGQVFRPFLGPQGPTVRPFAAGPQLVDLTLQGSFARPLIIGQGAVPPLVFGAPQPFDLTLQASFAKPLISGQGSVPPLVQVPVQSIDLTLAAQIQGSVATPPAPPKALGSFIAGAPQFPQQYEWQGWGQTFSPALLYQPVLQVAEYHFGTHQASLYNAECLKSDIWSPLPLAQGFITWRVMAGPEEVDFTLQGFVAAPLAPPPILYGPTVAPILTAPPAQADQTAIAPSSVWTPSTFSPGIVYGPPPVLPVASGLLPGKPPPLVDELGRGIGPHKRPGQVFGEPDPISPRLSALAEPPIPESARVEASRIEQLAELSPAQPSVQRDRSAVLAALLRLFMDMT